MRTIGERLKWLISNWLPERKRFSTLEKLSGIPADHWKNFWHGRQRAHEHMIQAVARQWPEHALWLATGIDDPEFGQTTPSDTPSQNRSSSGLMLSRKITIDEALHSTSALAALEHIQVTEADKRKQQAALDQYADDLMAMTDLAEKYGIPFDVKNIQATLEQISTYGLAHDDMLLKHRAQRIADMKTHGNQES